MATEEKVVLYQLTVKQLDSDNSHQANLGVYSNNIDWQNDNIISNSKIDELFKEDEDE